jgi:hypothetical protein
MELYKMYFKGVRVIGEVGIKSIKGGVCSESLTVATSLFTHYELDLPLCFLKSRDLTLRFTH